MIQILNWWPLTRLGDDAGDVASSFNEAVCLYEPQAAVVRCSTLTCGAALVLYIRSLNVAPPAGHELLHELEVALLAQVEGS